MTNDARQEPVAAEKPEMIRTASGIVPAGTKVWHYNGGEEAFGFGIAAWEEDDGHMVAIDGGSAAIEAAYVYTTPEAAAQAAKRGIDAALANVAAVPVAATEVLEHKITDEQIARVAEAIYNALYKAQGGRWECVETRQVWKDVARAAIAALTPPENPKL